MAIHSKLTVIKLDSATGGTLTDVSAYCNKTTLPRKLDLDDVTTFGNTSKQWLPGFGDGDIDMGGPWTAASHGFFSALEAGFRAGTLTSITFNYGPEGFDTGDQKQSGELIMTDYDVMSDVKGPVEWTAKFKVTGGITDSTVTSS